MPHRSHADSLLARADALIVTDPAAARKIYHQVILDEPANLAAHNALERLGGADSYGSWMHINCVIHPEDDIFRFFARHPLAANPVREYLSDGWRTLSELMLLLEKHGRSLTAMKDILEFAAGFGRFTRHLVRASPHRVACTDVQAGSVEFLRAEFGVDAYHSDFDPAKIAYPRQYQLVFVLSLFTHLPPDAWEAWLVSLYRALSPDGVLVISVHNEDVARKAGIVFDERGTAFISSSESPSIPAEQYGTTFTTDAFLHGAIRHALGRKLVAHEFLRFWGGQDAVVIRR